MASQPQQLREKLTFDPNTPIQVTLDGAGMEQQGRNGDTEYRYFLAGHQIMWVPEEAHAQIEQLQKQKHRGLLNLELRITKRKSGRQVNWTVEDLTEQQQPQYGYGQPSPAAPPRQEPPAMPAAPQAKLATAEPNIGSSTYYTCLCAALRAAQAAEKFAAEIGRPFTLDSSDVRAIATTLYIQAIDGGRQ